MRTNISRRTVLTAAASWPLAAALPARAGAPMLGAGQSPFRRFMLGGFEVTTLLAATVTRPDPHSIFGLNVDAATFYEVSQAAKLPTDQAQFFFTPTVVNTGAQLILFDTGLNAEGTGAALAAAGYSADQVDLVVLTHMHGDHIGGLMKDGAPAYANAGYAAGRVEFDAWAGMENEKFEANMRPLAEKTAMLEDGDSVASGVTALAAFGHTPGHMVHVIESEGKTLMIAADFANHYVWSLAHPDWHVSFDMDKDAATATRRRLLDLLSLDGMPFIGYHMPWPATGYVERHGDGYVYQPTSYQLML